MDSLYSQEMKKISSSVSLSYITLYYQDITLSSETEIIFNNYFLDSRWNHDAI